MEKLVKGVNKELVQDFYRAITNSKGVVNFQPIKMVNLCFVKFDNGNKVYMFNNPTDNGLKQGTKVLVDSDGCETKATVVSSLKIHKKFLHNLQIAMYGKPLKLKNVLGVYETKVEVKEVVTKFGEQQCMH